MRMSQEEHAMENAGQNVTQVAMPEAGQDAGDAWKAELPEELRGDPTVASLKSVADGMKMLVHAQRMVGRDKVAVPSPEAPAEDWQAFYDRLGRPESAEAYDLTPPDTLPEDLVLDEGLQTRFREAAHGLGLLPQQVQGLYQWYLNENGEALAGAARGQSDALRETESVLRKDWGFDYQERVEQARRGARELGGPELMAHLEESGLGNDPALLKALARAGQLLGEAKVDGGAQRDGFGHDGDGARREITRLQNDSGFMTAYRDRMHPEHDAAMARMRGLFEAAYPGPAPGMPTG